jgi:hypothetical protein
LAHPRASIAHFGYATTPFGQEVIVWNRDEITREREGSEATRTPREAEASDAPRFARLQAESGDPATRDDGEVIAGDPEELQRFWSQQDNDHDCVIYAEGMVGKAFGKPLDVAYQERSAAAEGDYDTKGTNVEALGRVLEREGVATQRHYFDAHASPEEQREEAWSGLRDALDQHRGVVVAVDANKLWYPDGAPNDKGGHAVWVTGLEREKDGSVHVVCNDSGRPDGAGATYERNLFDEAWQSSQYKWVATIDRLPDSGARA